MALEASSGPVFPPIVIRDAVCSRCTRRTFVIFDRLPFCRDHFLAEVASRAETRSNAT